MSRFCRALDRPHLMLLNRSLSRRREWNEIASFSSWDSRRGAPTQLVLGRLEAVRGLFADARQCCWRVRWSDVFRPLVGEFKLAVDFNRPEVSNVIFGCMGVV